jgi:hypothetical protein
MPAGRATCDAGQSSERMLSSVLGPGQARCILDVPARWGRVRTMVRGWRERHRADIACVG